jgi:PKD repeat protein
MFFGAALASAAVAQTIVVPAAAAAADGNSSSGWPFDVAAARLLYVYDSSHFTSAGITTPIRINQISWRANAIAATWTGSSGTVQVDLSTAPIDFLNISTTWNSNHGGDRATVYNGALTIGPGSSTAGVPGPFHVTITFATPFLYDPNLGDLTIDTIHSGLTVANTPTMDMVTTAGTALARRVSSIANPPAATATAWTGEAANVLEFVYTPAAGLFAGFQANVTGGASPLSVQFTDQSFSSAAGGVTGWAWDFNGDSVVDSTLQNPTFVYTACGTYNVALTVTDGVNPPSTLTRNAYIATDRISADFTSQVIGAQQLQFTDQSNMPATTWAWDLDGDTIIDSTAQNPVFTYPSTAPVNVTLTVTRLCSPPSTITKTVVPAQQLTTNLAANNGGASGWTILFDVTVSNPLGVEISSFDMITANVSTAFTADVWLKQGTYVGSEFAPADWMLVGQASGTSNPTANQPSNAVFATPLYIPAGTYGLAMRYLGVAPRYLSGAGNYSNGDLQLNLGAAAVTTAGAFTGTTINTPRTWSGTLYYGTHNINGSAGYGLFGQGCPGTLGISTLSGSQPVLGNTLSVSIDNLPFAAAAMVTGVSNSVSSLGPLPVDLSLLPMPGCSLRVSLDLVDFVIGAGTTATWNLALPAAPALSGILLYNQAFPLDPAANGFGFVASNAAGMVLGN